jgi:energy-coupling factor transporter ATP-binding protein EcfA2
MNPEERKQYQTFNARYLSLIEVAQSFIYNSQFEELSKNNHSLLMGPRGSGKTTLLKMLTPAAQLNWKNSRPRRVGELPFWGVYIPTDVHWKTQIDQFQKEFSNYKNYSEIVAKLIVTTNVIIALTESFKQIIHSLDESESNLALEAKLCTELINCWDLEKPIAPNIDSITRSLQKRLLNINSHIKYVKHIVKSETEIEYPKYYLHSYLDLCELACTAFGDVYRNCPDIGTNTFRWALCFDELEIAPHWLQKELLEALRSTHQKFIFKLTTSPLVSLYDKITNEYFKIDAQDDNDYKIIRIWTSTQNDYRRWNSFCEKLIKQKLMKQFNHKIDPHTLFGTDELERSIIDMVGIKKRIDFNVKPYEIKSVMWTVIKELAQKDKTFHKFLLSKRIDPYNPIPKLIGQKDSVYRKIKPIVIFRYQLMNEGKIRSRKVVPLFYGLPYIYEITEGNPRALISLIDDFISKIVRDDNGKIIEFNISQQSRIIEDFSERVLKVLSAHPDSHKTLQGGSGKVVSLGDVLSTIGDFFHRRFITDDFSMDPPGCFVIDKNISPEYLELLKLALDLGAIVYTNPKEGISDVGLTGKTFKLSYLLYPKYVLPKQEYKAVNLSSILHPKRGDEKQQLLF